VTSGVPEIQRDLDEARLGIHAKANELADLMEDFHKADVDPLTGDIRALGVGLRFDIARKEELAFIYENAIENDRRPPAEDIRAAMAERAVRAKQPALWAEYHNTHTRISALKSWIGNQKSAISAGQTVLKAERE